MGGDLLSTMNSISIFISDAYTQSIGSSGLKFGYIGFGFGCQLFISLIGDFDLPQVVKSIEP